jgi:hypothetical protein
MTVRSGDEASNGCVIAAAALSVAHILTVCGTDRQIYTLDSLRIDQFFLVNHAVFLSPVVVLLLMRRACGFVGIYAIPILIIFVARMYYVWQFYWFGINSMAVQKGDALSFFDVILDTLSAAIVACALLATLSYKLIYGALRLWKR